MSKDHRKRVLAQIHIARKDLGLDEDTYRLAISTATGGKRSCSDCTGPELQKILQHMKARGFKPKASKAGRKKPRTPPSRQAVMNKVEALLAEAGRPWAYADGMAVRMFKVERVDWLDDDQLYRLMQGLVVDANRHGREYHG